MRLTDLFSLLIKNMRIALFGATGKTGKVLLKKLLIKEYEVKALVRNPSKLENYYSKVSIIKGDILDPSSVDNTIKECDVIICVVGHVKGTPNNMQLDGMKNIITSMSKNNIKKLITLTGAGVFTKGDNPSFFDKIMQLLLKIISFSRFKDGANMVNEIKETNLDWIVIRAPFITNEKAKNKFSIYNNLESNKPATRISREDLVDFILENITSKEYVRKLPVITY